MSQRPAIFISAVSRELRSARQLVANTLTFLGYDPEWQEIFGTEEGDLRAMLRRRIGGCKGVVQLLGRCYGVEPPTRTGYCGDLRSLGLVLEQAFRIADENVYAIDG
jgi:hypothetical protein